MKDPKGGLVFEYESQVALAQQINLMLSVQAQAFSLAASSSRVVKQQEVNWAVEEAPDPSIGVWPSTEFVEPAGVDSKGRPTTRRSWFLVLSNRTGKPVKNVRYRYEPESFSFVADDGGLEQMAPDGIVRYAVEQSLASPGQANCIVTWQYAAGPDQDEHETIATVRT